MTRARCLWLLASRGKLLLHLKICNYRTDSVLLQQMGSWELCQMPSLSPLTMSHRGTPEKVALVMEGSLLQGTEIPSDRWTCHLGRFTPCHELRMGTLLKDLQNLIHLQNITLCCSSMWLLIMLPGRPGKYWEGSGVDSQERVKIIKSFSLILLMRRRVVRRTIRWVLLVNGWLHSWH